MADPGCPRGWLAMPRSPRAKTSSESMFEHYLRAAGLSCEDIEDRTRALPAAPKHPDYVVRTGCGLVVCEVKEFDAETSKRRVPRGSSGVGVSPRDFQRSFDDKLVDAKEKFNDGRPLGYYRESDSFVVVLYSALSYGHTEQRDGVNVVFKEDGVMPLDERFNELLSGAWRSGRFDEISAVAVLAHNRERGVFVLRSFPNPGAQNPFDALSLPLEARTQKGAS